MTTSIPRSQHLDPMTCPSCGSQYTSSLPAAYARFPRDFRTDEDPDLLPEVMQPPQRESTVAIPLFAFILTLAYSLVFSYNFLNEFSFLRDLQVEGTKYILFGAAILLSLVVSIRLSRKASHFNHTELPSIRRKWHNTAICRRCGNQFSISDPNHRGQ